MARSCGAALILALASGAFQPLCAEGVVRDSIGPIPSGRGGTNIAFSDNLSLINDNPAGIAGIGGLRFELNATFLKTEINYRDPQNDEDAKDQVFVLPDAAISYRVTESPRPITLGFGVYMPSGYGAEYHLFHQVYGKQKYRTQAGLYKFMPSIGVDLGHGLSIGAAAGLAYQTLEVEAPYTFQTGTLAGVPALVDVETDGFAPAWNVGIQYKPTERWTLGLSYIEETHVDLEGRFTVDLTGSPLAGLFPSPGAHYRVESENTWPRSLGVGTAYRFDYAIASVEVLWFDWSSAFDAFTFHLSHGDNPAFDAVAGTRPSDRFPLNWHDSYTVRIGGEFPVTPDDTLRAGYVYVTNPIPERTLTPLIPGILEHAVSFGYGHRFGRVGLDLAYQFSFGRRQTVGTSDVIGGDFDSSSLQAFAHWFFAGVNVNF